jgi:hypothetical protein
MLLGRTARPPAAAFLRSSTINFIIGRGAGPTVDVPGVGSDIAGDGNEEFE